MNTVVTGANGMVGANLVRMLVARGDCVKAITYGDTHSLDGLDVERVECNILDTSAVGNQLRGADTVYHLASVITLRSSRNAKAERVNTEGARAVAEACLRRGVRRLVHFSSIHAFSPHPINGTVVETRPLCGDDHPFPYDRSKSRGQRAVLAAVRRGLDAVIIHPTGILGPHDFAPSQAGRALLDIYLGRTRVLVAGGFNWVDVRDVCSGTMAAAERGMAGENYILSGHHVSVVDMGRAVAKLAGRRPPRFVVPQWVMRAAAPLVEGWAGLRDREPRFSTFTLHTLAHHQVVSHEKAARILGYTPRPFSETLGDTFEWYATMGMLGKKASSSESVGDFRLGKVPQRVKEGDFQHFKAPVAVRFSRD